MSDDCENAPTGPIVRHCSDGREVSDAGSANPLSSRLTISVHCRRVVIVERCQSIPEFQIYMVVRQSGRRAVAAVRMDAPVTWFPPAQLRGPSIEEGIRLSSALGGLSVSMM